MSCGRGDLRIDAIVSYELVGWTTGYRYSEDSKKR